jgi:hydrogenase maturation protease
MTRILVAGIGNIFKGDDAFGVEVAQRMSRNAQPEGVDVKDFGIAGVDLAYALLDGYDAVILVDTAKRGAAPGTVSVIVPERPSPGAGPPCDLFINPHELDPASVLHVVEKLGTCPRLFLVACEPQTFGEDEMGAMGLSPPVASAVDEAVKTVERLVEDLLQESENLGSSL